VKFPGYWVSLDAGKVLVERTTFDETELDPATSWRQAWQNQDADGACKGYVDLEAALASAASRMAAADGKVLGEADLSRIMQMDLTWTDDCCELQSLSQLLAAARD